MQGTLELAVIRFCAQLEREGYRADFEQAEGAFFISACEPGGGVVGRYVARRTYGGVQIEEAGGDPGP